MSEQTKIEWATSSWNPWIGCTKVSPGCKNCYAEHSTPTRVARKAGRELWGKGQPRQRTSPSNWSHPRRWNRQQRNLQYNRPASPSPRIFPSLCDWLDDEVPIEWLADFLKLIHDTPNLDWLLLTKRPENWLVQLQRVHAKLGVEISDPNSVIGEWLRLWMNGDHPANVWIGTSVEDQKRKGRIDNARKIPAGVHFLSLEPLLEDLGELNLEGIDWVIIGGESGPGARPCNVEWIRDLVRQCKASGVACFVKQLGKKPWVPGDTTQQGLRKIKHAKGGDPSEWPADLRVREFPK